MPYMVVCLFWVRWTEEVVPPATPLSIRHIAVCLMRVVCSSDWAAHSDPGSKHY